MLWALMNPSDSYTITFDASSTQYIDTLAGQFKTTRSDVIAKALVLLDKVQGKIIIIKDAQQNTVAVDIKRLVK